jgi:transketolase
MVEQASGRDAYGKALLTLGELNDKVVVLDADLSCSTRTAWFAKEYPHRFFNAGIAEQNCVGMASGLAMAGKIPFVSSFAVFLSGRAWEQIRNGVAYPNLNVKLAATHAGLTVGEDGATHQALEDVAIMRSIPNMNVLVPADAIEARQMILSASEEYGPFYIRMSRSETPVVYDDNYKYTFKRAHLLMEGTDVCICAMGIMVHEAVIAANILKNQGIKASVLNVSTIKPIDESSIIQQAKQTGAVVTAEEHSIYGGLGSAVSEVLAKNFPVPMEFVGVDYFGESGNSDALLKKFNLSSDEIVSRVKKVLKRK